MRNVVQLCLIVKHILFMRKRNHAFPSWVKMADRFASRRYSLKTIGDRMIDAILLLDSVILKYRDLPVSRRSIISLSFRIPQQLIFCP